MGEKVMWLSYEFTVCSYGGQWNNVGGIYIFVGLDWAGQPIPYYIGQCDSFQNRIPSHEQWDRAQALGATQIHAMTVPLAADRGRIEEELIGYYQPKINTQLR